MRYERSVGHIVRVATGRALTDCETAALRAFVIGTVVKKACYARRYPQPTPKEVVLTEYNPDELGDGFRVGNVDSDLRGLHLGVTVR